MKKIHKILTVCILTVALLLATFRAGVAIGAQNGVPGSVNDPLITKSYLDERLAQISGDSQSGGMDKVTLSKGDCLSGSEGTTFVMTQGSASASGSSLVNITKGESMADGMSISKYNTFLVKDETGAIRADSACTVFVSGEYSVVQAAK
jgi:hypothetical protein